MFSLRKVSAEKGMDEKVFQGSVIYRKKEAMGEHRCEDLRRLICGYELGLDHPRVDVNGEFRCRSLFILTQGLRQSGKATM